jgi:hypothetical protein
LKKIWEYDRQATTYFKFIDFNRWIFDFIINFNGYIFMTTVNERKFLLWFIGVLLSILAFIGAIGVNTLIKMNQSINEIKTSIATGEVKRDALQYRVEILERKK